MAARARRPAGHRLVTLSSDVGTAYAAQMKAVLLSELPAAQVVDLTHELAPHAVAEAAFVLAATLKRFPSGAVHVVVVDPGVGGARQPVAVDCADGSTLVGPDNGVLAPLAELLGGGTAHRIVPTRLGRRPRVGTTFDGRDVFAPAAARLARGAPARALGPRTTLRPLPARPARRLPQGALGSLVHVDRFGNLLTNVPSAWVPEGTRRLRVRIGRARRLVPMVTSYERTGRGHLAALASSFGTVELAVAEGRATEELRARAGARVELGWKAAPPPRRTRRNRK